MENEAIKELRKCLFEKLRKYNGVVPIRFDIPSEILSKIIIENGVFTTCDDEILRKIDLSNVSFDGFYCKNMCLGGLHGVRINPKIYIIQN